MAWNVQQLFGGKADPIAADTITKAERTPGDNMQPGLGPQRTPAANAHAAESHRATYAQRPRNW